MANGSKTSRVRTDRARTTKTRNQFPASCLKCGHRFPPDSGVLCEKEAGETWAILCDGCLAYPGEDQREAREGFERRRREIDEEQQRRAEERARLRRESDRSMEDLKESYRGLQWMLAGPSLAALDLKPPVTVEQIRAAFRRKALVLHPDHGGDAAAFVRLRSCYEEALSHATGEGGRP